MVEFQIETQFNESKSRNCPSGHSNQKDWYAHKFEQLPPQFTQFQEESE